MVSTISQLFLPLRFFFLAVALFSEAPFHALGRRTVLMSFKEKPPESNVTFGCSPSGPCVPCFYSEKGDNKCRCSETGYRISLKCIEMRASVKDSKRMNSQNARSSLKVSDMEKLNKVVHDAKEYVISAKNRSLLDDSSSSDNGSQAYITYRSCIPPVTKEKLSVLSFEGFAIFLSLISGSIIYLRKKKVTSVSGFAAGRVQTLGSDTACMVLFAPLLAVSFALSLCTRSDG